VPKRGVGIDRIRLAIDAGARRELAHASRTASRQAM
jgi:hypothetical protein